MDDEDEADDADMSSGEEWNGEDEIDVKMDDEDDDDVSEGVSEEDLDEPSSLVVTLQYGKHNPGQSTADASPPSDAVVAQPKVEAAPLSVPFIPMQPKISSLLSPQPRSPKMSSQVKLPPMNGNQNKWQSPAGPDASEAHRPATTLPAFSTFLYKPQQEAKPINITRPESTNGPSRPEEEKSALSGAPPQPFRV
jgi:hypothetical protein